ncbi:hypothetical protein Tco_1361275 [Tanacetum coccineum]
MSLMISTTILNIVEHKQAVKGAASSSSSSSSQNMAFVSSPSSTNDVNTAYGVSTAKPAFSTLRIEFNKFKFNLATYKRGLASIEDQLVFYKKNEVILYEQLDVLKRDISYKDSEISMLKRSRITNKSRKGVGFVNYNVVPPPPTALFSPLKFDLSNFGLEEFQQPKFEGYGPKTSKSVSEDISNEVRESPNAPLVKELVSDDKFEKKTVFPTFAKIEFIRPKQQDKLVRKPVKYAEMYSKKCHSPSLIGPIPKEECHVVERKAQVKKKIALVSLTKETQMHQKENDRLAILRCPQIDQTATIEAQMIEEMIG